MSTIPKPNSDTYLLFEISKRFKYELMNDKPFPLKDFYFKIIDKNKSKFFFFLLGGPFQTMLTGTLGSILLLIYRNKFDLLKDLRTVQWLIIFISLFWLRQTANLVTGLMHWFISGKLSYRADEIRIAFHLNLPILSIQIASGIIGIIVLSICIFKFIPFRQRLTFISSGIVGGVFGYLFWLVWFGKYILP